MISAEDIKKLARLAKLRLTEDETVRLASDMQKIIGFADTINKVTTASSASEAAAQAGRDAMRDDKVRESFPREEILRNVNGGENGFFGVRKRSI